MIRGVLRVALFAILSPQAMAYYGRIDNPQPVVSAISPSRIAAGSGGRKLAISGRNFLSSSSVTYNGTARTTTFVDSTRLFISLSSADLNTPGTFPVVVSNPPPGGGTSSTVRLVVEPK